MSIAQTLSISNASSEVTRKVAPGKENYDVFLKLLLEQMKNQDPTNPQDPAESLSQLAQLSQLEQLGSIDEAIGAMSQQIGAMSIMSLLGREVGLGDGPWTEVVGVETSESKFVGRLADGRQFLLNDLSRVR